MADEGWKKELEEFDGRTAKRRAKNKDQDQEGVDIIREGEERRDRDKPAE
jgi:hypothetical protein